MPVQASAAAGVAGTVVLEPRYVPGLKDLEGFSHIILLYHFHRCAGYRLTVTPFLDTTARGLFATRAPRRPNPIGLSTVRLERIDGARLYIRDVDVLDGTPLLDIKPWASVFDARENTRDGWLEKKERELRAARSDRRFTDRE
jgi:tRNA-Thr(GGU) m(6)t(6)A37 methyltransferase TsaA